jgi:hypothetical protein
MDKERPAPVLQLQSTTVNALRSVISNGLGLPLCGRTLLSPPSHDLAQLYSSTKAV